MLAKKQAPYPMQFSGVHSPQPSELDQFKRLSAEIQKFVGSLEH
jgi:hypothetical protein